MAGSRIPLLEARDPCPGKEIKLPSCPKIEQRLKPQAGAIVAIPLADAACEGTAPAL